MQKQTEQQHTDHRPMTTSDPPAPSPRPQPKAYDEVTLEAERHAVIAPKVNETVEETNKRHHEEAREETPPTPPAASN